MTHLGSGAIVECSDVGKWAPSAVDVDRQITHTWTGALASRDVLSNLDYHFF